MTQCYEDGRFSYARFDTFLARHDLDWERTDGGQARLDADYLKARADAYPALLRDFAELREVLSLLRSLRKGDRRLLPSSDGMLRCPLWPFGTATGRNAPRASEFILARPGGCVG